MPTEALDGPDADPVAMAREIALRLLDVRDRTRHELERALAKRRVPADAAREVLDRLTEVGLVDDRRFAEATFERQQRRRRSTRALRQELRTKGVDAELIDEAAAEVDSEIDLGVARDLVAARARSLERFPYQVRYRRMAGQLARRGFSSSVIATALRELPAAGDEASADDSDDPGR